MPSCLFSSPTLALGRMIESCLWEWKSENHDLQLGVLATSTRGLTVTNRTTALSQFCTLTSQLSPEAKHASIGQQSPHDDVP